MKKYFNLNKKLGFGLMRLPGSGEAHPDLKKTAEMVDEFIARGFEYFDTAHGYHDGMSEVAVGKCISARYPREKFVLTDKLTKEYFKTTADIRPFFENQLKTCGVEYFDFYLMHAQNEGVFNYFKERKAYEEALRFKREGKILHFGISFHDKASVLDGILTEYPEIEVVQIQYNYLDYDDAAIESRLCLETCEKHGKPVIVMEPLKGGSLVRLTDDARAVAKAAGVRCADLAIRFAASPDSVMMVLSGMSTIEQLRENTASMSEFKPLSEEELAVTKKIAAIIRAKNMIACTACRYCVAGCPKNIAIPDVFACYNARKHFNDWNSRFYYKDILTAKSGKASDCVKCGKCEAICPQKLPIRSYLEAVVREFGK
ncbi:MAG: aldo/keto reductase [Clostridia bacterium]|nr:aldo/keto reductase [Clostridia bacterium]